MNLTTLNDEQLIEKIRTDNCSDSVVELSRRHKALVVQVSKKYANAAHCSGVSLGDFLDDTNYIIFEAAKGFDETKNVKFSTWLGNRVRYHCLNTLNKQSKYYSPDQEEFTDHLADSIANEKEYDKSLIHEQMEYVLNILRQLKDRRIETIFRMRYLGGGNKKVSFSVIAKHLKMSTQGVIDLHNDFVAFLSEKMRAESNMDKI